MKADLNKAENIGSDLLLYKDSLAKRCVEALEVEKLNLILENTSPDPLAAEQELVMGWRFYTQQRELQICAGEFRFLSSDDEIRAANRLPLARQIVFDPVNIKGIACIKASIQAAIKKDVLLDAIKWQAVKERYEKRRNEIALLWNPAQSPANDTTQDAESRKKFTEERIKWCRDEVEARSGKQYSFVYTIRRMLEEHRDYWAKRRTVSYDDGEDYDDSRLNQVFAFAFHGPTHGLWELSTAWDDYLKSRINELGTYTHELSRTFTDEEKAVAKEERRKLPADYTYSHPNSREILESHIRTIILEDIIADIPRWERRKLEVEAENKSVQEHRLKRIQHHRDAFISKVRRMFGQQVLELITNEDIEHYSVSLGDHRAREEDLWYSILKGYNFDQNTSSCLYFIRQGDAIKIGITDELNRRFAQIKTSAAVSCKIENVVYTHHGKKLERRLHKALARYNSHLEWFVLPSSIENMLFAAKSVEDIENVLKHVKEKDSDDMPE